MPPRGAPSLLWSLVSGQIDPGNKGSFPLPARHQYKKNTQKTKRVQPPRANVSEGSISTSMLMTFDSKLLLNLNILQYLWGHYIWKKTLNSWETDLGTASGRLSIRIHMQPAQPRAGGFAANSSSNSEYGQQINDYFHHKSAECGTGENHSQMRSIY